MLLGRDNEDPLLLIPYLSADHACYAFQLPAYTERFSCIAISGNTSWLMTTSGAR